MADLFAVISKAVFEKAAAGLGVGDVHAIASYDSNPKPFEALASGGTLYVVTARPGDALWLVAVLTNPKLAKGKWVAPKNTTPITDLTAIIPKLKFASGNGIKAKPGQLGMSLQTPRALAEDDVALIQQLLGGKSTSKKSAKQSVAAKVAKSGSADLELAMQSGDDDAFAVYADRLIEKGDPRGELIQLQRAGKDASALLKKHKELVGPFAKHKKDLSWKTGFVDGVTVKDATAAIMRELLDHPSARFLSRLSIEVAHAVAPGVILQLAKTRLPTLRMLSIKQGYSSFSNGSPDPAYPTYKIGYGEEDHKKGDALWSAVPNLEILTLAGFSLFHTITLQNLRALIITEGYPTCDAPWQLPKLEKVTWSIDCDDTGTGTDFSIELLCPLWKSKLPALREVDVSGCSSVGYIDIEDLELDDDDDDSTAIALRRQRGFKKLAAQLDVLVLPETKLASKKQIAAWLA